MTSNGLLKVLQEVAWDNETGVSRYELVAIYSPPRKADVRNTLQNGGVYTVGQIPKAYLAGRRS